MFTVVQVSGPVFYVNQFGERVALSVGDKLPGDAVLSSLNGEQVILESNEGKQVAIVVQAPEALGQLVGAAEFSEQPPESLSGDGSDKQVAPESDQPSSVGQTTSLRADAEGKPEADVLSDGHHHQAAGTVVRDNLEVDVGMTTSRNLGAEANGLNDDYMAASRSGFDQDAQSSLGLNPIGSAAQTSGQPSLAISMIGALNATVTEDTNVSASGQLGLQGGAGLFPVQSYQGQYGSLTVDGRGAWTYTLDNNAQQVQGLTDGEQVFESFQIHAKNSNGVDFVQAFSVDVHGTGDTPIIVDARVGSAIEDTQLTTSGQLTISDSDVGEDHFVAGDVQGKYGQLHLASDGGWTYQLNNQGANVQSLAQGETVTEQFLVHSADGTSHTIRLYVAGSNDGPVLDPVAKVSASEDGNSLAGLITATDLDHGASLQFSASNLPPGFIFHPDGSYSFDPANSAYQHLKDGMMQTFHVPVTVTDEHGGISSHLLALSVTGTNDRAQITGVDAGSVNESANSPHILRAGGKLDVNDVDDGESSFKAEVISGQHGGFVHVEADGTWHYSVDRLAPEIVSMQHGQSLQETFDVHSADGTVHTIVMTIQGDNQPAVIVGVSAGVTQEDNTAIQQAQGQLSVMDPDKADVGFQAETHAGKYGQFQVDASGHWSYVLDNSLPATQALRETQSETEVFFVKSADGTPHGVQVMVMGAQDAANISGTDTGVVTEDGDLSGRLTTSGTLTVQDVDAGESLFPSQPLSGQYGQLLLSNSGQWVYLAENAQHGVQQLGANDKLVENFEVHSFDGTRHTISVTIEGTNDAPTVSSSVSLGGGTEDTSVTLHAADLLANASDVDHGETAQLSVHNLSADHGTITDNKDGTFTFTPEPNYNGTVSFTYDIQDPQGATVATSASMNLAAVSDAAVITGQDTGSITEDHNVGHDSAQSIQIMGSLSVTDPDAGEDHFIATNPMVRHEKIISDPFQGELHIDRHGNWDYQVANGNPALQALKEGETRDVIYEVRSADGTTHRINITVTGTNDAPIVSGDAKLASGTEDTSVTLTATQLLSNASDVDHGETAQLSVHNLSANHGTITDNKDGTFTFTPEPNYNGAVSFTYDVQDPQGATVATSASMTLAAVADAAVIGGVDTGSVTEATAGADMSPDYAHPGMAKLGNVPLYADGKLTISDPDAGEANFDTKGIGYNYHGQYGYLLLNEDGAWHYYADAGNIAGVGGRHTQHGTAIDQLGDGQSLTDTITVYSKDGTAHDIVITIHGSNDKPYCSSEVSLQSGTEDTTQTLTKAQLLANTVDVDANDAGKLSIANVRVDHGSIRDNQDGTYTFTPARDYNGDVHFNYDVQDAHGGVTHTGATTSLAAVSDAAVITGTGAHLKEDVDLGAGTTAYNKIGTSGQFHVADPDGPSQSQFPDVLHGGIYIGNLGGKLQVNSNGNYFYGIENKAVNHLAEGQEARETFTIHSVDGTTHQVEFVIEGTNDAPFVRGAATLSAGIEDTAVTLHVADLLAQAGDYDDGETAQLSVHKLSADHGTITDNKDGTYTFTPESNYNGAVSFTYDKIPKARQSLPLHP